MNNKTSKLLADCKQAGAVPDDDWIDLQSVRWELEDRLAAADERSETADRLGKLLLRVERAACTWSL